VVNDHHAPLAPIRNTHICVDGCSGCYAHHSVPGNVRDKRASYRTDATGCGSKAHRSGGGGGSAGGHARYAEGSRQRNMQNESCSIHHDLDHMHKSCV
jgi:hypothetical protein